MAAGGLSRRDSWDHFKGNVLAHQSVQLFCRSRKDRSITPFEPSDAQPEAGKVDDLVVDITLRPEGTCPVFTHTDLLGLGIRQRQNGWIDQSIVKDNIHLLKAFPATER